MPRKITILTVIRSTAPQAEIDLTVFHGSVASRWIRAVYLCHPIQLPVSFGFIVPTRMTELPKAYNPAEAEKRWYEYWYRYNLFDAEASSDRPSFTIVIPPPNVTGVLHLGHMLNNTIQDLYIRLHRMRGFDACWIPGTDHAGIATQTKVVQALASEGINFRDLGREEFIERVWDWKRHHGGIIYEQLRAMGASLDWRRDRFTFDEGLSEAVREVFVRLYDQGMIYRGKRIVNWSPAAQTTLSDEEVKHREVADTMYTLRYHLADGTGTVQVATARPETLFGDVAVAVNPDDERYLTIIGKEVIVPLTDRKVAVIADAHADPAFGTGAVKITPAHDPNDFEVGMRHNLPMPNTIQPDGSMNELAGPLAGMDRFDARRKAVELLRQHDLIEKEESYVHSVGYSERGGEQIEPYLSDQWFVRMAPLAGPALSAVLEGAVRFYPEHWVKTYEHWMSNIRDWAISRQLWWGHRIPVYYADDGRYTAARTESEARVRLELPLDAPLRQDEDVLDTWFSSWLWPFSVHGWGSSEKNERDLSHFYPTDLLVTGPDIIFFWVARMIMAGLEFMKDEKTDDGSTRRELHQLIPFRTVYFTSIIRDAQGRKMSKQLGNSPDPLDVIAEYGADALRFTLLYIAPTGQDVRFAPEMCELGRNFANKIWNAGRFLLMKRNDAGISRPDAAIDGDLKRLQPVSRSDMWVLSRFHSALNAIDIALSSYHINDYARALYEFVWGDFCDWYIELLKGEVAMATEEQGREMIRFALALYDQVLRMLHPLMPFVSEEIWQTLAERHPGEAITVASFPTPDMSRVDEVVEREYLLVQGLVEGIRRMRTMAGVAPSKLVDVTMTTPDEGTTSALVGASELMRRLCKVDALAIHRGATKPTLSATEVVRGVEVHVHLAGVIDVEKERAKTEKEIARLQGQVRAIEGKLANDRFVANAPEEIVHNERAKLANYNDALAKLQQALEMYV